MKSTHIRPHIPQLLLALLLGSGAAMAQADAPHGAAPATAVLTAATTPASAELPMVEAEVRRVDTSAGKITLKHGNINNLDMPPMTMVFQASSPRILDGVKTGDKVRFTVDKVNGAYMVMSIEPMQ